MQASAELGTQTVSLTEEYVRWEATVLHRLETGNVRLPVMPTVASRAFELANNPDLDTNDLTPLLENDPAIAANILRVAASAVYGAGCEIRDLGEAVNRIGTRTFCQLVSAFAIQGEVYGGARSSPRLNEYRAHSLATASLASHLALLVRVDGGAAFLAGLLYTIGKPVIWHLIDDLQRLLGEPVSARTIDALVENHHVPMARQVCQEWELPELVRAVSGRHASPGDEDSGYGREAAAVALADQLAHHLCGTARRPMGELEHSPVAIYLDLKAEDFRQAVDDVRAGAAA